MGRISRYLDESCNAYFIGSGGNTGGSDFPEPLNCDISQITSTNNELDNSPFRVYPNPSEDQIKISKVNGLNELIEYKIIDLIGKEVLKGTMINGQSVNINNLQSGVYSILLKDQYDIYYLEKFIKK